jgi:aryl sulfotransferase
VGPPLEPPKVDIVHYYHEWLDNGGYWFLGASFWEHVQGWWNVQSLPNVLLIHFNNLKADMPGEIRRIAQFLEIQIDEAKWPTIVEHCTIGYMRSSTRATATGSLLQQVFDDGVNTFFHKGTNGRWKDVLSAPEIEKYERAARNNLTPDCANWLATGKLA